jgi:hypothetical protein
VIDTGYTELAGCATRLHDLSFTSWLGKVHKAELTVFMPELEFW